MQTLFPFFLLLAVACSAPSPTPSPAERAADARPAHAPVFSKPVSMTEAKAIFDAAGVQPGQPLPKLALRSLGGASVDLEALRAGRPMALVTCSLTCNVARRQQREVAAMQQRLGERAFVVMVYTIDAHPKSDACPYTGVEWVPQQNEADGVLVRQPTTLEERLALAPSCLRTKPTKNRHKRQTLVNTNQKPKKHKQTTKQIFIYKHKVLRLPPTISHVKKILF